MDPLSEYIEFCRAQEFNWHDWNCVHFAQQWVERYEGLRCDFPVSFLKHNVCSQLAAFRYSRELGGIPNIVTTALAREPVPASFAAYGDLVYFGVERSAGTLGICNGRLSFVLSADEGLSLLNTAEFEVAWKLKCA